MNNNEYVKQSLELHLFFDRIMKEHSFFLEVAFTEKDNNLKQIARNFQQTFSNFLKSSISLADGNVTQNFLSSNEIVTKNTLEAESRTTTLTTVPLNTEITRRELNLRSGNFNVNEMLIRNISSLNQQTLPMIQQLIEFKNSILNNVLSCRMYTTNYPLLIEHIMNEAKMYHKLLTKIENRIPLTKQDVFEQELFWNDIMKEHAEFIRGLLDPTEEALIKTANQYAEEYKIIIKNLSTNQTATHLSLNETINFRNFKIAGEEGILNCKIKSIIIPLLADHVVREANHFIRLLQSFTTTN